MQILVAKLLGLLGLFGLVLAGILVPVRLLLVDYDKAHRYRRALSLCNSFGGGVFLATCFNALLPAVRDKVGEVFRQLQISSDYPLAETMMMLGFFLTVFVEQAVLTFRKEKPSFIDLETFNAGGSEAGSDSEYDTPFISSARGSPGDGGGGGSRQSHGHQHGHFSPAELAAAGPLRLASLVLALSAHSVFEGLALGLQEDSAKLGGLFLGVAVHETLAAVALGVSVAKALLGMKDAAKLGVTVSLMIPLGMVVGMGIESAQTLAGSVVSVVLQGLAAGTFLFVTFFEILSRELNDKQDRLLKVLFLILGYAALAALVFIKW
ncbi:zinc transporter ZIP3-like [Xiphias gladius]|uniref:zinc transporter ZIP3-like n=1 Tax=Xiphias gladius TaxID=8245 RepID=UPI001A9819AD|nr:zinc transporter ZIP3-like [Xiphias gladius]XP_039984929.1 zinc transporter ZIP3-like [Xiphias gladius]XP_039984930.1 zinc transporter ZIP3-like [Xiphias gladius]XP_039984931.1 zinc transporter ZIP3-like [Xiphias gladius]XP_039984932.1 zinc transporter ZIP3-like [Xiphias gladius]XP_039984933.1 zinc transporter ZIP3-like [Xiphias gladius]XP_039984934.1 zinc transporter ZIP3-like [Xiphias gladius]XP_039984935.1 zinc transporter ZIP3-like [Xiphias gladius]XP_039984937.1 zinc transporter ZIP